MDFVTELAHAHLKIQALTLELNHHKRMRFGCKNEAFSSEQRELFDETCAVDGAAIVAEVEQLAPTPRPRKALPAELPRIEYRHEPESCACGQCGQALALIREDISEQLDVEPARFFVNRHIRPQYACRTCETVTAAPIPAAVIDGGLASPGLHAWVLIQKYLNHLPLYRIEQISGRHGVPIARSTLAEWVGRLGVALQPLVTAWPSYSNSRRYYTPTKPRCSNLTPAPARRNAPIYGRIAAMISIKGLRSSSLTTKPVAAASMPGLGCRIGAAT